MKSLVLNVDNNDSARRMRSRILRRAGFAVVETATAADAMRLAAEHQPGAILLDIRLPDKNGFEVCKDLRSDPRTEAIPIIHISSLGKSEHGYADAAAGSGDAHLKEPVDPALLATVVRALMRAATAERALTMLASDSAAQKNMDADLEDMRKKQRRSHEMLSALLESTLDIVVVVNQAGVVQKVSRSAARILGRPMEELVDVPLEEHIAAYGIFEADGVTPITHDTSQLIKAAVHGEATRGRELRIRRADGARFTILADSVPLRCVDGKVCGGLLIARDITHRKQIEEELAASRAQLETTLDTMISGIGIVGLSGEIVRANPSARALFGIVGEQDFPKHMLDLQNKVEFAWPDGRPLTPEEWPVLRSVRGEVIPYLEMRVRIHATGETKLVSYRSAPVRDPRGIITHAVINIEDITSRKAAEDALRKSEERYRQYIELVPAAVWRWDYPSPIPLDLPEMELAQRLTKEGRVGECNLVYARQKGYASPEEMEGRSILETGTGSFGDHINRALLFFRQGCRIADMEYVDDSGETVRHYLGSLVGVVADGCLKSIWGTRRDITERKLAEQALARSEERLRVILESASLGTWTYCPAAGIFDADPQAKLLHGLTADAPHGKRLLDAIHPDDRARVSALLERQNCDGAAFCEEVRAVLPDGSLRWLAYNGRYVADPVDGVRQWLGVVSDVTARKSAEEELRENQLRFSMLAEAVPDILITSPGDPDNLTCDYINQRAAEYTGMPLSVLREPAGWSAAFHPEDLAPFLKAIMASLETGTPLMHEVRARRADGVYRWHRMQFVPMWNAEGKVVKWFGVCADIDDLKRMGHELEQKRSELEEYNRELAESNRDLQQFAAVVAHDLQSPLSAISMTIEQVEQLSQERHDRDSVECSKLIMASVNRMRLLIRKVFDYSRLDSNAAPFMPVDCNDGLRQTLALLALDIASSGAVVTADSLPVVLGDLCQIEQVFQNLIGNAVKYKRADTPVRIHVSAERRHDAWVFSVADNGIGIPAGDAQRIFKPFEKLRPASEGAGIGLAICQRVIERHGGRIWVESEPGAGSKFYFTIPANPAFARASQ